MKSYLKLLIATLMSMMMIGVVAANPIDVVDLSVTEKNGAYNFVVTVENVAVGSGNDLAELSFSVEEFGTSKVVDTIKVDSNGTVKFTYTLDEITDSSNLFKKGEEYTVTVSADGASENVNFLYGTKQHTDGLGLIIDNVYLNGKVLSASDLVQVDNGETLELEVAFTALENFDDARLRLYLDGYEHSSIEDSSEVFSVKEGISYTKTFVLDLPEDMNTQKSYLLRLMGANDLSGLTYTDFEVYVGTDRHRVDVEDLVMTPSSGVEAGENFIANVRMKNRGEKNQDSVKVTIAIPELGVSESSYVSNLNADEIATSDDLLLYVPEGTAAGQYTVQVSLAYNDGYTQTSEDYMLNVLASKVVEEKNLMVSYSNNVDLVAGATTSLEVVIANPNADSVPVSLAAIDSTWADVTVSPSLAMVKGGDSETFTIKVTPKSAIVGEKDMALSVKQGSDVVSDVTIATYVEGSGDSSINWVNVVLAVLLIVAIIILLALVVTIARRKDDKEDEDFSSSEEYY